MLFVLFFSFLSLHGFLIQSKELLRFQIPFLSALVLFHKPIVVILNILPVRYHGLIRVKLFAESVHKGRWCFQIPE